MALDDQAHVEAVAIIRRLHDDPASVEAHQAAEIFLREHHPSTEIYLSALHAQQAQEARS